MLACGRNLLHITEEALITHTAHIGYIWWCSVLHTQGVHNITCVGSMPGLTTNGHWRVSQICLLWLLQWITV
jgi:hypothetical protein